MPPQIHWSRRSDRGVTAGLIAGAAMALTWMLQSSSAGAGFWTPMELVACSFYGFPALAGGVRAIAAGIAAHFTVAAIFGAIFSSFLGEKRTSRQAFLGGLAFGLCVWAGMTYLALPALDAPLGQRAALIPGWWLFFHLVYGAFLSATPGLRRRTPRRPSAVAAGR